MSQEHKLALVGIGKWGKTLLKELSTQAHVKYVCHTGRAESVTFLSENYPQTASITNLDEILVDAEVDAVVVATPTSTHFEIAKKVLSAGKHLMLEKPGCSESKELKTLVELAKEKKSVFSVGYEFAHHPVLAKIKELIISPIETVHTEWFKWGTFTDPAPAHLLSHEVSIIKRLCSDPIQVEHFIEEKVISDTDILHAKFSTGNTSVYSTINRVSPEKRKTVTIISKDKKFLWNNNELFEIDSKTNTLAPIPIENTSAVSKEIQDFLNSIKTKDSPLTDGQFAVDVYEVIDSLK